MKKKTKRNKRKQTNYKVEEGRVGCFERQDTNDR
jgi:hypothetical protein